MCVCVCVSVSIFMNSDDSDEVIVCYMAISEKRDHYDEVNLRYMTLSKNSGKSLNVVKSLCTAWLCLSKNTDDCEVIMCYLTVSVSENSD